MALHPGRRVRVMPTRSSYAQGTPNYIDIGSPDIAATKAFYGSLFGWEFEDLGEEAGNYNLATIGGDLVAGVGPAQNPGPPFWSTYVAVDDADLIDKIIQDAGGTVVVPPMDVMTAGRMGVYIDRNGAFFSTWQAGDTVGCGRVNEHGTLCWNELNTWKLGDAKVFYRHVFGWHITDGDDYAEYSIGGKVVGGMMPMASKDLPKETPEHWLVYFAVDDINTSAAKIRELGGTTMMDPFDVDGVGQMVVAMDPQGAVFAAIQLNQPGE